jgi:putative IMPACT (imprinted ancient) family translation regulator
MQYLTLAGPGRADLRVRGSSFLAFAAPAATEALAREVLAERQREHFDATHNCSAWRLRHGVQRANDAGEPGGSAGMPILAAIEGAGLTDCVVVVTRRFGGTKLGVGGLVRAYGEVAARALAAAPKREGMEAVRLRVRYAYGHTAAVMRVLSQTETSDVEHGFAGGGAEGELAFSVPRLIEAEFASLLSDSTAGEVTTERVGEGVVFRPHHG